MAPFLQIYGISRSQNIRVGRQVLTQVYQGDVPGVDVQRGVFQVPIYVDLADGVTKRDLQHHGALGAFLDLSISATVTSDLFWSTTPTPTGAASPVTVPGTGVLRSRTFGTTSANSGNGVYLTTVRANLTAGASITVVSPSTATRQDIIIASPLGVFSVITGVEGGPAPAVPAGYILLDTISTTTGGVISHSATGVPTS